MTSKHPGVGPAKLIAAVAVGLISTSLFTACERDTHAMTPQAIERQYGVSGAYQDRVVTPDGSMDGTVVPVTLPDGRKAQLIVPQGRRDDEHSVYFRDDEGLHPIQVKENVTRADVSSAPRVVERRPEASHRHKRSWEKDALIIGGSAGAGTAIGAVAEARREPRWARRPGESAG